MRSLFYVSTKRVCAFYERDGWLVQHHLITLLMMVYFCCAENERHARKQAFYTTLLHSQGNHQQHDMPHTVLSFLFYSTELSQPHKAKGNGMEYSSVVTTKPPKEGRV